MGVSTVESNRDWDWSILKSKPGIFGDRWNLMAIQYDFKSGIGDRRSIGYPPDDTSGVSRLQVLPNIGSINLSCYMLADVVTTVESNWDSDWSILESKPGIFGDRWNLMAIQYDVKFGIGDRRSIGYPPDNTSGVSRLQVLPNIGSINLSCYMLADVVTTVESKWDSDWSILESKSGNIQWPMEPNGNIIQYQVWHQWPKKHWYHQQY
jgi:hypothetical protein